MVFDLGRRERARAVRPLRGTSPWTFAMPAHAAARRRLAEMPAIDLGDLTTPVHELSSLRRALGGGPRLLIKRDDVIPFGFGGNKVRKLALVAARARAESADTLVTTGTVQSNHARVTAAVAAHLGMQCVLVLSGAPGDRPAGNAHLVSLLGAEVHYVASRAERSPAMGAIAERLIDHGRRPFMIPLGASTPLGALGYARALGDLLAQIEAPDAIVHATSSGGTQAGLVAGCALFGVRSRVIGVSADEPAEVIQAHVAALLQSMGGLLAPADADLAAGVEVDVDAGFVGDGYGVPTAASEEAVRLLARHEGVFLDPAYTAKAMAALIARVRDGRFGAGQTILFWHTGGLPGLFA
jgi:1-aminocyclopropane-1-carboxylate deaminase/D-cysteine desulfhydrase-like pyridoxal-dependent ACC family enzyme